MRGAVGVRPVEAGDLADLTRMMARAFSEDPCFEWVFRGPDRRLGDLELLFRVAVAVHVPRGISVVTDDRAAAALWAPPDAPEPDESVMGPFGVEMAHTYEPGDLARLGQFFGLTAQHHPKEPHYYLGVLAADLGRQGQGLGSACLSTVLQRVDADRMPAYLESSNEKNVPLYERHGFRVVEQADLPDGGPPVFFMWRDAVS
ncbi:MAG TPA: GNAT family N-acetyltransferase [Acidimicrobiales bacterium]|jgi:GNAT superfamily N-acetyltransferase|nr:GNAT family N-acetyltransferase [Acidimicrobiales bacterium]